MGDTAAIKDAKIDRISNLPGDVLPAILAKLPLRDAVRTSILSTDWRYKWCVLSQLVIDNHHIESANSQRSSFTTWEKIQTIVYNYLRYHNDAIEKFKLSTSCPWPNYGDLYQLIYFLSKKEVKEVSLEQHNWPIHDVPDPLFSFQHLSTLQLTGCRVKLPFELEGLKFLVSLHLIKVYIDDETFARLISGCPAMERLVLLRIEVIHHFRIVGPSLKGLKIVSNFESISFENCPNLKSSEISLVTKNFGRYSSSEDDSLDSGSESGNYDSESDHVDSESNGSHSGSEVSDSGSNLSDYNTDSSSFGGDDPDAGSDNSDSEDDSPDSEDDSYNSGTDHSEDESDYSANDSNDSEQEIACNLLSTLGCLSTLERISLCTRFFKFLTIDDINKRFPIAHKQLVAVDLRDIDFRHVHVVGVSLLLLNKFPNLEKYDFSVKYSGNPAFAFKFVYEQRHSYLPFEKLRAVKMRYRCSMGIAFSYLKLLVDLSPMLEMVTIIKDGNNLMPQDLLEEKLQLLNKTSPQVKVKYEVPNSGFVYVL
ncbi:F-box/LRR-repeat protein At3g59200-like isoform X2 [Tripterygium wilfordii]|uniref:F-box/LRR-repeat protein At3g59200-like isoform X2 n=1 Tax=Tripterygium wilfordii TaxID=458696 RepID=UPI0018F86050|nr:F-box/LRR-repeat protein At3g59200-like isoform X2 [Tripterygium wilfordii]XP_038726309.1 F-box/LRR-repeat protein At3g59200-like isoform X2 [Tripterygium wilfordii]XP_038726310.1 F-box/LRR-repeat protein At3g59200-like isoform X2 [Tripterygium wilfordii]